MNYALIADGIVENLIWLHPQNSEDFPEAVPIDDVPATVGDTYENGVFYRNGERVMSREERMQQELAEADAAEAAYQEGVQEA